jgi:multiple sugar transport system permease protein/putative chitobiose transport system permease protein
MTIFPFARARAASARRRSRSSRISLPLTVLAAALGLLFIVPAVWILSGSVRPSNEIFGSLTSLNWGIIVPGSITFDNYAGILSTGFARALLNSLIVCLGTVAIGLLITATAAYALAVLRFPFRNTVFAVVVISFMVPFEAIAIPLAQQFSEWNLTNTFIGLILPGIGNGLAVFNLRQFFLSVPPSLREAALIDGASEPRIMSSVYLPISGAALANTALLLFLGQWGSYLWPLLVITEPDLQMAPVALTKTVSEHATDYGQNFAGVILLTLVPAILMLFLQRYFTNTTLAGVER